MLANLKKKTLMSELWRYIPNTNNRYKISNMGNVISLCKGNERLLKPNVTKKGYLRVSIVFCDGKRPVFIHRLVAESFLEYIDGTNEINHKDGNKRNNIVTNLEYCTSKYNSWHKFHVLGYSHSAETRAKIASKKLGKKLSEDARKKISIGHIGIKRSADSVRKTSIKHYKKVIQYDLNMNKIAIFNSMTEASIASHTRMSEISSVCNGKRRTANGYKWRFAN